ncbi:hypothetical protein Leryth_021952 [Lithospermum erythrorhizon]|nr:hypothetical protein Leryth_021952 [Lithospermum erythrorhizon]
MRGGALAQSCKLCHIILFVQNLCFLFSNGNPAINVEGVVLDTNMKDDLLPEITPNSAPLPLIPFLAPSPLTPFTNRSVPKLSGLCSLKFGEVESLMSTTAMDCLASFAPYLANTICCPQLDATLIILIGQSSKDTNTLALNGTHAKHCLSDFEQILVGHGSNNTLSQICPIHPSNLTEGSCPVYNVSELEASVDSSSLLAACGKINVVNECCEQVCQNTISLAAKMLALKAYGLLGIDGTHSLADHSSRVNDCKGIVLRWLASKLDPSRAKEVLRGLSNCKINEVCPLAFPSMSPVIKDCENLAGNFTPCCHALESYMSFFQNQSFTTNLQALNCAASLGTKLQKANITKNVYELCRISLRDFSLQAGPVEKGCLLPSSPSDLVFDESTGVSFVCDLNDNIAAPWPSSDQIPASICNKTIKIPALPAAASGQTSQYALGYGSLMRVGIAVLALVLCTTNMSPN